MLIAAVLGAGSVLAAGPEASGHSAAWLRLLHMPLPEEGPPRSRVDTPGFFLHPQGGEDPAAELAANLAAIQDRPSAGESGKPYACRFPARAAYLRQAFAEAGSAQWPQPDCPALQAWRQRVRSERLTLVFASAYLSNPSSMFGHTLLRLDREADAGSPLLAWAVNFAAQTADEHGPGFAYRGLTGGYPGRFGIYPYYTKVQEYARIENRDLWEYQLNFSQAEIDRLLDHLWELRGVEFPYFFLDENCSFQLLALLEVARPAVRLTGRFGLWAAPVDTIRVLREQAGLVSEPRRRPAMHSALSEQIQSLDEVARGQLGQVLVEGRLPSGLTESRQIQLTELAHDWARYQQKNTAWISGGGGHEPARLQALAETMLARRSQLPVVQAAERDAAGRAVSPDEGHRGGRLMLGYTHAASAGQAALLGWRLRMHDMLDPPVGVNPGQGISVLDGVLGLSRGRLRLADLTAVQIASHSPRDEFFQPWSWLVDVGYRRDHLDAPGVFAVAGGLGADWPLGARWVVQMGAHGKLLLGPDWRHGRALALGPQLGLWGQPAPGWRLQASAWYLGALASAGDQGQRAALRAHRRGWLIEQQFGFSREWGLRLGLQRQDQPVGLRAQLAWLRYF